MSAPENFNLPRINTKSQICISLAFSVRVVWKGEGYNKHSFLLHSAQSQGQNGWQRIHIKDRLLFSHCTMPSLQSNGPHWMNSITHTVISYCHCRVRGDSRMGIQFYHSAPSKSRRESEIVEKYSPQDECDRHFKHRICYSLLSHCWPSGFTHS